MKVLDAQYRARSRLTERRFFSIFYSRITPSPLSSSPPPPPPPPLGRALPFSSVIPNAIATAVAPSLPFSMIARAAAAGGHGERQRG